MQDEEMDVVWIASWRNADWFEMEVFERFMDAQSYCRDNFGTDDEHSIIKAVIRRPVNNG